VHVLERDPALVDYPGGDRVLRYRADRQDRDEILVRFPRGDDTVDEIVGERLVERVVMIDNADDEVRVGMRGDVLAADRPDPFARFPVAKVPWTSSRCQAAAF
jgi:hypothetical protein